MLATFHLLFQYQSLSLLSTVIAYCTNICSKEFTFSNKSRTCININSTVWTSYVNCVVYTIGCTI